MAHAETVIGVEDNKLDAVEALNQSIARQPESIQLSITVETLQTKYPQGAEKMLITAMLGDKVPQGGLPLDVGVIVINVTSAAEIGRLLPEGRGIQERVITISGPAISKPGNYRIPIGTPLRFALDYVGVSDDISQVYLGGPMMGQALPNLDISITKGTSGFIAFRQSDIATQLKEYPCIHCSYCVDVCPMHLNPSLLGILAKNGRYEEMAEQTNLMDCFECGSCSYVCPSHIPLVQRFRAAKKQYRKRVAEKSA